MPLIISDSNNYTRSFNKSTFKKIIEKSLKKLKLSSKTIYITFISDYQMTKINHEFAKIKKSTDVLSFNYENDINNIIGEIFISVNYCKKNIKKNNNSLIKEISIVAIHGILHLIDYDHDNKINEKIMFDLQENLYKFARLKQ
jgi:probable rRNA maturation factor|tara:strand:+ start:44610 stop:45038 length:429 start_codon:yes stop_codon:yes gene_type:complete